MASYLNLVPPFWLIVLCVTCIVVRHLSNLYFIAVPLLDYSTSAGLDCKCCVQFHNTCHGPDMIRRELIVAMFAIHDI